MCLGSSIGRASRCHREGRRFEAGPKPRKIRNDKHGERRLIGRTAIPSTIFAPWGPGFDGYRFGRACGGSSPPALHLYNTNEYGDVAQWAEHPLPATCLKGRRLTVIGRGFESRRLHLYNTIWGT